MALTERKKTSTSAPGARIFVRRRRKAAADVVSDGQPPTETAAASAVSDGEPPAETAVARAVGGGALLVADWGTVFALLNHGRRLAIARAFGVQGRDANIVTVLALALMARAARERAQRLTSAATPAGPDVFVGFASVREVIMTIAGPKAREMPGVPALIMIGVLGAAAGPAVAKSLQRARGTSQRMNTGFHDRYGYLVDPGHRRQGRADRRRQAGPPPPSGDRQLSP